MTPQWTIQQVAKAAGTTSRTLRHYDHIGLLKPSAIGENGYRLYDASALIRLQRILALRDLGMSLPDIRSVLDRDLTEIEALADLEHALENESARIQRQLASIQRTISALKQGEDPMNDNMFDGFKHDQHKEEVEERWGKQAWQRSNDWWQAKSDEEKAAWQQDLDSLNRDWQSASEAGADPAGELGQQLAARHTGWLRNLPDPISAEEFKDYVLGLAEMYVNDPRFAANYGGDQGATFVRDALHTYVENNL